MDYQEEGICTKCGESGLVSEDIGLVCENCGYVVNEMANIRPEFDLIQVGDTVLRSGTLVMPSSGYTPNTSAPVHVQSALHTTSHGQMLALNNCRKLASKWGLSKTLEEQIMNLAFQAMDNKWKRGRTAELTTASCCYIVCRLNSKPVTLLEVADAVQCDVFTLGRVYIKVTSKLQVKLADIDPALYIERAVAQLALTPEQEKVVIQQTIRLINLAKDTSWITTGRRPMAITGAALLISLEVNKLGADFEHISELLNVAGGTLKVRHRELRKTLTTVGRAELIWGQDLTERNIVNHIPMLLKQLELKTRAKERENATPRTPQDEDPKVDMLHFPPSYTKNALLREKRREKIERAKKRIANLLQTDACIRQTLNLPFIMKIKEENPVELPAPSVSIEDEVETDEEDLLIGKLLLHGVPEVQILEGHYDSLSEGVTKTSVTHANDVELTEKDIPDHELSNFIRTPAEVELISEITEKQHAKSVKKQKTI